jgi:threonine/homoserine/homoserine lactone efflux protein|tara:strand:+ start:348 stop:971 length:624 start_codon:yes stop_codon:yes gene_type:complete
VNPEQWVGLALVFCLGAMSPGPSLAVVLRNTLSGGRQQGIMTGLGHGIGFGVYAFLAAAGIATALSLHESTEIILKSGGIIILVWLGIVFVRHAIQGPTETKQEINQGSQNRQGFRQGFLIALLNPKIMAWMLALYTPFIQTDTEITTLLGMGLLGMVIDGTWYVTVATVLTTGNRIEKLKSLSHIIDGTMGILMFIFAGLLVTGVL